ncbi:hypothetical protein EI94DRAFT_1703478 [Lactarius quietus]|nr:hypothetical protein EI94DRAFT_1703478 [Lactarius quietus]
MVPKIVHLFTLGFSFLVSILSLFPVLCLACISHMAFMVGRAIMDISVMGEVPMNKHFLTEELLELSDRPTRGAADNLTWAHRGAADDVTMAQSGAANNFRVAQPGAEQNAGCQS